MAVIKTYFCQSSTSIVADARASTPALRNVSAMLDARSLSPPPNSPTTMLWNPLRRSTTPGAVRTTLTRASPPSTRDFGTPPATRSSAAVTPFNNETTSAPRSAAIRATGATWPSE